LINFLKVQWCAGQSALQNKIQQILKISCVVVFDIFGVKTLTMVGSGLSTI
jgi:hypothetical protein